MTYWKFKGLSLDGIFKMAIFCHNKTKCSNTNSYTSSIYIYIYFFFVQVRKDIGENGTHSWKLSITRFVFCTCTRFFSIEPVLSRSAISLPLLMISLLPVIPQYIFKAIHLHFLLLNTTPVFSIVSAEGQFIVPVVKLPTAFITHFQWLMLF